MAESGDDSASQGGVQHMPKDLVAGLDALPSFNNG
jgi:hypothetical protein